MHILNSRKVWSALHSRHGCIICSRVNILFIIAAIGRIPSVWDTYRGHKLFWWCSCRYICVCVCSQHRSRCIVSVFAISLRRCLNFQSEAEIDWLHQICIAYRCRYFLCTSSVTFIYGRSLLLHHRCRNEMRGLRSMHAYFVAGVANTKQAKSRKGRALWGSLSRRVQPTNFYYKNDIDLLFFLIWIFFLGKITEQSTKKNRHVWIYNEEPEHNVLFYWFYGFSSERNDIWGCSVLSMIFRLRTKVRVEWDTHNRLGCFVFSISFSLTISSLFMTIKLIGNAHAVWFKRFGIELFRVDIFIIIIRLSGDQDVFECIDAIPRMWRSIRFTKVWRFVGTLTKIDWIGVEQKILKSLCIILAYFPFGNGGSYKTLSYFKWTPQRFVHHRIKMNMKW